MTVEPGRLLADRYRVEDLLTDRAGARSWRAVDEVLRRSVAVDVLPVDAPRAQALVNAARASASVTDSRFLRVLDASQENGDVYVVREWARGEPLDRVLGDGPLPHRRAAWVVREVAEALAIAHRAGIHHWRLVPGNVVITETGAVRIVGLSTEAALSGIRYADSEAEAEDVRGLGRLLYCTLVNRWPGGPDCDVRRAPYEHGRLMRPRQVRAGVPRSLDEICDRILGDPPQHHATPLRSADEVAAALADAAGLTNDHALADPDSTAIGGLGAFDEAEEPAQNHVGSVGVGVPAGPPPAVLPPRTSSGPKPAPAQRSGGTGVTQPTGNGGGDTAVASVAPPGGGHNRRDPGRWKWSWLLISLIVLVCAVAAFLIGFTFTDNGSDDESSSGPTGQPTTTTKPVQITNVSAWDPMGEDGENDDDASLAADGDPSTTWTTMEYYGRPDFGGLKSGLGLVLDLGEPQDVSRVTVNVGGDGTDFEIRVAPGAGERPPANPDDYQVQGKAQGATGQTQVELDRPVTTRYVVIWLTKLPPEDGNFRGRVHEVSVAG